MKISRISQHLLLSSTLLLGSCGLLDDSATRKPSNSGLIATPVTYYSTSRARYLGAKYKDSLDRLVERIVRNSKTANLQFANNISSVGGIGFFTHSATKSADERYLEVVLAAPETFETKGAHSDKVSRLFSSYGLELLTILSGENDIYQDKELTGYGLNISWRNVIADPASNRVTLERAIVYLAKDKARNFLRREINQNDLLADATIFAVEEDGPLNLVSYRPPEVRADFRPAIREDDIPAAALAVEPVQSLPPALPADSVRPEPVSAVVKKPPLPLKEPVAKNAPPKPPLTVTQKPKPALPAPAITVQVEAPAVEAAPVELAKLAVSAPVIAAAAEKKAATPVVKPIVKSAETARAAVNAPKPVPAVPAPMIVPAPPAEAAKPAVVAPPPRIEIAAPPVIAAKPIESAAPARVADLPKPPPVQLKPFLPPAPTVAKRMPAPEPQMVKRPAPPLPVAMPESKPVEIVSAPPVVAAATRPAPVAPPPVVEKTPAKPAAEQLALLSNKPIEAAPPKPAIARAAPKPLEGFIIQLAFNDKDRAQRWAEGMEKKGYAVSVTEAGAEGALRVRLGNFVLRDDAERQLKTIKQEGLNGIILNLPQAFRPEARTSIP